MPYRTFISYSSKDLDYRKTLEETYLRPLEREGLIEPWSDRLIEPGEEWRRRIEDAMDRCHLGLLLVSPDFVASEFIGKVELEWLGNRARRRDIRLIAVRIRPGADDILARAELDALQWFPKKGTVPGAEDIEALVDTDNDQGKRDRVWTALRRTIQEHAEAHQRAAAPHWEGIPFPGLRSFNVDEGPIFFGRDDQTADLEAKIVERGVDLLAIFGPSGAGKSSLMKAGLLWRLHKSGFTGGARPMVLTPGQRRGGGAFGALILQFERWLRDGALSDAQLMELETLEEVLPERPDALLPFVDAGLTALPPDAELVIGVDQFEEVFTVVEEHDRAPFVATLCALALHPRVRVVLTIRRDFFSRVHELEALNALLNSDRGDTQVLLPLSIAHYRAMIKGPAVAAGFSFESPTEDHPQGLLDRLLADADASGGGQGTVPLLAFTLEKLLEPFAARLKAGTTIPADERRFTHAQYDAIGRDTEGQGAGGLQGAVASAAAAAEAEAAGAVEQPREALARAFSALVRIGEDGREARRPAALTELTNDPALGRLVDILSRHRLLVVEEDTVELAHEILFRAWPSLADWLARHHANMQLRERMRYEARQWDADGRSGWMPLMYHEPQQELYAALEALGTPREQWTEEPEHSFLIPEAERILAELERDETEHDRRAEIGLRLKALGPRGRDGKPTDPRPGTGVVDGPDGMGPIPELLWHEVPGGEIRGWHKVEGGQLAWETLAEPFVVAPFRMARYPITIGQYRLFKEAEDGYGDDRWWDGLTRPDHVIPTAGAGDNHPVVNVSWYEATAFCRWLDARLRAAGAIGAEDQEQLRLPWEWQWQLAATGGDDRAWPWGDDWHEGRRANTLESGLGRVVAVGLYPRGAQLDLGANERIVRHGPLDLAGNVWEWCFNSFDEPTESWPADDSRALRGGSWFFAGHDARSAFRFRDRPYHRNALIGFRVCVAPPIMGH